MNKSDKAVENNSLRDISQWDNSNVKNMNQVFEPAVLTGDISHFDQSNITDESLAKAKEALEQANRNFSAPPLLHLLVIAVGGHHRRKLHNLAVKNKSIKKRRAVLVDNCVLCG
jgi:hypothetical protein